MFLSPVNHLHVCVPTRPCCVLEHGGERIFPEQPERVIEVESLLVASLLVTLGKLTFQRGDTPQGGLIAGPECCREREHERFGVVSECFGLRSGNLLVHAEFFQVLKLHAHGNVARIRFGVVTNTGQLVREGHAEPRCPLHEVGKLVETGLH